MPRRNFRELEAKMDPERLAASRARVKKMLEEMPLSQLTYKGFEAKVEFDEDARIFHGEVINTRDVITFQGSSLTETQKAFEDSVDDYLEFRRDRSAPPTI